MTSVTRPPASTANEARCLTALESGDVVTMKSAGTSFVADCERVGLPINAWQIAYHSARRRMLEGDLGGAEQAATEALTLGTAAGFPDDALTFFGAQLMVLNWMQGRLHEMTPLIEQAAKDAPALDIFRPVLACARSFDGAHDEVRQLLDKELANDIPMIADPTWLAAHTIWAMAVARSGHRPAAALIHQRLLPFHDQFATAHINVSGSVAHYLGLLAHTLDRQEEAERWFDQALAIHEAMDAPFFVAMTQTAWAELLADRDQPGDADRARALVATALPVASQRGFGYIERDAHSLLERLG